MSSSHQPKHPTTYIDIGMYGMSVGRPDLDSDSHGGARPSYEEMMKELACKLQGEHQSVRHFAAVIEAAVINIYLEHPQKMDEEKMAEVKKTRFYHGLKRVYEETFVHLHEEGASFERLVDAVLTVEEALLKLKTEQGEALKIQTFSGTEPPPKNETIFEQWIHDVKEAQARFPEPTVKNWILGSLKGPPADAVRNLGPDASIANILQRLEGLYGAVVPLDVKKNEDPPCRRKSSMGSHHKRNSSWGWARTDLEPKVLVHVYERPLDAILDLGASISFIDEEIVEGPGLGVHSFICDVPQCVSFEGTTLTKLVLNVIGWIELELGILGVGLLTTKLWVVKSMFNKGVPIILGSHQIKKIFLEANVKNMDCWQQPWKFIYEYLWKEGNCLEDLSDSDQSEEESFDIIPPVTSSPNNMDALLDKMEVCQCTWEDEVKRVEKKLSGVKCTALQGIPGPSEEPDEAASTPTAEVEPLPLEGMKEPPPVGGDESSVFVNLDGQPEHKVVGVEAPPCNPQEASPPVPVTDRLAPHPTVSCRITPTGEATFSLQWK